MTEQPTTAAGRGLLDAPDVLLMLSEDEIIGLNEGELELQILAIEAEAGQQDDSALREAARDVVLQEGRYPPTKSFVVVPKAALRRLEAALAALPPSTPPALDVERLAGLFDFDPCHECDNAQKAYDALVRLQEQT